MKQCMFTRGGLSLCTAFLYMDIAINMGLLKYGFNTFTSSQKIDIVQ